MMGRGAKGLLAPGLAAVVLAVVSWGAILAANPDGSVVQSAVAQGADTPGTRGSPYPDGPPSPDDAPESSKDEELDLDSPEAQEARDESRDKYVDEEPSESRALMTKKFPDELLGAQEAPSRQLEPEDYESFITPKVARVDPPGEEGSRILLSNSPLKDETEGGEVKPVDLDLRRDGHVYKAQNPLVDVSYPEKLSDPIRLGSSDVTVRLTGQEAQSSKAEVTDEEQLFFHEAAPDTDLVLTPTEMGAQLFAQIRSPLAPSALSFDVDVPPGAELRDLGKEGVEVVLKEKRIALIGAPKALDAQGTEVETRLQLRDGGFELIVEHQSADLAYPILVDPPMLPFEDWLYTNWTFHGGGGRIYWNSQGSYFPTSYLCWSGANCESWGPYGGLYIYSVAGWSHPAGAWAEWYYTAPGQTTFIPEAHFYPVYWERTTDTQAWSPYLYEGLRSTATGWVDAPWLYDGYSHWGAWDTFYSGVTEIEPQIPPANQAVFGMASNSARTPSAPRAGMLGGAYIYLDDPERPSVSLSDPAEAPTHWIKEAPELEMTVAASDPGLGVNGYAVYADDKDEPAGYKRTVTWVDCGGSYSHGICPASDERVVTYPTAGMPDGRNKVTVSGVDPVGWETEEAYDAEWDVRIDRSGPTLELSGSLADAPDYQLTGQSYDLNVTAREGSLDDRSLERSGVEDIKLFLDGATAPVAEGTWPDCPEGSCRRDLDYTLDASALAPGKHTLEIRATDQVGNLTTRKLSLTLQGKSGVITSPKAGDKTARRFTLTAQGNHPDLTGATFEYKAPGGTQWQQVPLQHLRMPDGSTPSAYPLALDGEKRVSATWDLPPSPGMVDGKVKIRARFAGGSAPTPPAAGDPALHWRLGEPEGTVAADSTGNDRKGTYLNSPTMDVAGAPAADTDADGAVDLDGVDDGIASTSYEPFVNGAAQTFAGWAHRDSANEWMTLISGGPNSDGTTPYLMLNHGANASDVWFRPGGSNGVQRSWQGAWPGTGQWVHWALVFNEPGNKVELFINGQSKGLKSFNGQYADVPGTFRAGLWGDDSEGDAYEWDGKLDEVMVYERALTLTEIQGISTNISQGLSQVVPVTLERDDTTSKHASAPIGPGNLDLLTGNFTHTADDVKVDSYASDLTVSRTHASREPGKYPDGPFGPGWISSVPVDAAGSDYVRLSETGPTENPTSVIHRHYLRLDRHPL